MAGRFSALSLPVSLAMILASAGTTVAAEELRSSLAPSVPTALVADGVSPITEPYSPLRGVLARSPAARWEDGHVTGNGTLGAIVMGDPAHEIVIGNHSRLFQPLKPTRDPAELRQQQSEFKWDWPWITLSARRFVPDIAALLPKVRELIKKEGVPAGYFSAQKLVCDEAAKQGYMGYQSPGNYHPGFKLHLDMPVHGTMSRLSADNRLSDGRGSCPLDRRSGQFRSAAVRLASRRGDRLVDPWRCGRQGERRLPTRRFSRHSSCQDAIGGRRRRCRRLADRSHHV